MTDRENSVHQGVPVVGVLQNSTEPTRGRRLAESLTFHVSHASVRYLAPAEFGVLAGPAGSSTGATLGACDLLIVYQLGAAELPAVLAALDPDIPVIAADTGDFRWTGASAPGNGAVLESVGGRVSLLLSDSQEREAALRRIRCGMLEARCKRLEVDGC